MDGKKINNLFIPTARTSNLKIKGPRIWNALPNSIKNMTSTCFLEETKSLLYF